MKNWSIGLMSAVAAVQIGCAGEVQPGETRKQPTSGETTFGDDDTTGAFSGVAVELPKGVDAIRNASFADIASYTFHIGDQQMVAQWLISGDGLAYRSRECAIRENGVDWRSCSTWTSEHALADLGLPEIGAVEGMSSFTIRSGDQELVTQRLFGKFGAVAHERTCLVSDSPKLEQCTSWGVSKLSDLGVEGVNIFKDDLTIVYQNDEGLNVVGQTLLGTDGSQVWQRQCVVNDGETTFDSTACRFGEQLGLDQFNIPVNTIAGRGGFTYQAEGKTFYSETVFASTRKDAGRRVCEVTSAGVDWNACSAWEDIIIGTAVRYGGAL